MMKRICAVLLALLSLMNLAVPALAENVTRADILREFPGYEYDSEAAFLHLQYGDLHEEPELEVGNCFLWVALADGEAPTYDLIIGGSTDRGMPHRLFIRTIRYSGVSKEYDINILNNKTGDSKILMLNATALSDLADLVPDILSADKVTITLRNSYIAEDEEFTLNETHIKLIEMTYAYHMSVFKTKNMKAMKFLADLQSSTQYYTVKVNPYQYEVKVHNGTGGLYPWLTHYMQSRYPDYNLDGKDVEDFITYIIGRNGLGLTYDQLYNMLVALDDETLIHTTLDALIRPAGASPAETPAAPQPTEAPAAESSGSWISDAMAALAAIAPEDAATETPAP